MTLTVDSPCNVSDGLLLRLVFTVATLTLPNGILQRVQQVVETQTWVADAHQNLGRRLRKPLTIQHRTVHPLV